jgi:hypothetical protein
LTDIMRCKTGATGNGGGAGEEKKLASGARESAAREREGWLIEQKAQLYWENILQRICQGLSGRLGQEKRW